jgi:hypothetical protein
MTTHELLTGEVISVAGLDERDRAFLKRLSTDAEGGADYFELLKRVKGPDALPLRGRAITPTVARSPLYRVAHDIADRVGIKQGYLLPPTADRTAVKQDVELLSLTEAADLIGITRPAAHQALIEERLAGQRVGNAWVVRRPDADAFKRARSARPGGAVISSDGARAASRHPSR